MKLTAFERFTLSIAPQWTMRRLQARAAADLFARNYEAASSGRRTSGWTRNRGDVNSVIAIAGAELRTHARDLLRNNSYARRGRGAVVNSTVGWGAMPKPSSTDAAQNAAAAAAWKRWSDSTDCDAEGRTNFAGLQQLVMRSLFSDGEALVRRRFRRPGDGLALPLQIQVLEADMIDTAKIDPRGIEGGPIVNGVELDGIGRRVAYWLFDKHPGGTLVVNPVSRRVPASEILHVFDAERAGQARGVSWLGSAIVDLKELGEYEDAELMKQKISACFAAFVTDTNGEASPLGEIGTDTKTAHEIETFEPGMIAHLPDGKSVTVASPPSVTDASFTTRTLRKVAAGLGITYEDLTGDYSQVNFSSARMARIAFKGNVRAWQNTMLLPQFLSGVWSWAMLAANLAGTVGGDVPPADWSFHPLEQIEPDKEVLATTRAIRAGLTTPSEAIREAGGDPDTHFAELAKDFAQFKALGLKLDSDPSETSQAGLTQARVGAAGGAAPGAAPTNEPEPTA